MTLLALEALRGGPIYPEAGLSIPRRACSYPGGPIPGLSLKRPICLKACLPQALSEAGLFVRRRACLSRCGPIHLKAGLSVRERLCLYRGGPIYPGAGLSIPRRAHPSCGGLIRPEVGLSVPEPAFMYIFRCGPIRSEPALSRSRPIPGLSLRRTICP